MTPIEMLIYCGVVIGFIICVFIGKFLDPAYRCKKLRQITKKPYIQAKLFFKDARLVNTHIINAEEDSLWVRNSFWAFTRGTVVIERKNSDGKLERDREAGFKITSEMLKTDEGCPTLYLDGDKMRPLQIWEPKEGQDTKPNEVGAVMLNWNENQALKKSRGLGNQQIWTFILLFLVVVAVLTSWNASQKADLAATNTIKILSYLNQSGANIPTQSGGTVNIVQPRG